MPELQKASLRLENLSPRALSNSVLGHHYPIVFWKLPMTSRVQGLIDLRPDLHHSSGDLEDLDTGFLINPFAAHHPCKGQLLKADLSFELVNQETLRF